MCSIKFHSKMIFAVFYVWSLIALTLCYKTPVFYSWFYIYILSSQAAQSRCTVVRPIQKSIRKWEIRPPVKSQPLQISTWNYAYMITSERLPTTQILVLIGTVGASPHIGEILPLCDFLFWLSCPVLSCFSGTRPGRTAGPIFTLYGSNDVFPRKEVPFGG